MTAPALDLDTVHLAAGGHHAREDGVCLLEAAAWFAGREHTANPPCVSPVLTVFGQRLNDVLPDDRRQQLRPLIPRLVGTTGDGRDEVRGLMALDWLVRVYTPAWLRLVPALVSDADALAGIGPVDSLEAAAAVGDMVREVASRAAAAGAAAGVAAGAAAGVAAWVAAGVAAGAAAGAAWVAAGDAWVAAGAAWVAAGAAWVAAGAAWVAGVAAGVAAGARLQPTVEELQQSAVDLYDRMITGVAA
jgi:hypothetical protein